MVLDAGWTLFGHQYGHLKEGGGGASWGYEYQRNSPPNFRLLFEENAATGPPHHNRGETDRAGEDNTFKESVLVYIKG
jgi:hypothetical protein